MFISISYQYGNFINSEDESFPDVNFQRFGISEHSGKNRT